jgi:hypothetical protein
MKKICVNLCNLWTNKKGEKNMKRIIIIMLIIVIILIHVIY